MVRHCLLSSLVEPWSAPYMAFITCIVITVCHSLATCLGAPGEQMSLSPEGLAWGLMGSSQAMEDV